MSQDLFEATNFSVFKFFLIIVKKKNNHFLLITF